MANMLVLEWMEEFEALTESEIHTYSTEQEHNHEIMMALYDVLSEPSKYKLDTLVDGICRQLLDFYRSGEPQLKKFAIQYVPILVFLHLTDKTLTSIQTLLVSLYNLEMIDQKGQPRTLTFRVPSIAQCSIYHDANNLEPSFIAESSLRRWEECNSKLVSWGPLPQVECLNAQNRHQVVTALLFLYNQQLFNVITQGIEYTCKGISKLVTQGFQNNSSASNSINSDTDSAVLSQATTLSRRIPVTSPFLIELLNIVYNAVERDIAGGQQALDDVTFRASYEALAEVLLTAHAVKNLLKYSSSVSITPRPSQTHSISKSMITNASFRTKKLPDDIPIQDDHQDPLDSITEEQEETEKSKSRGSVSALKGHLPKLPGLSKKHRDKSKPNEVDSAGDNMVDFANVSEVNNTVHVSAV